MPFVVEARDGGEAVPASWVGRRFESGDAFGSALIEDNEGSDDEGSPGALAHLGLLIEQDNRWMSRDEAMRMLRVQQKAPHLVIHVQYEAASISVTFDPYDAQKTPKKLARLDKKEQQRYRVLKGHVPLPHARPPKSAPEKNDWKKKSPPPSPCFLLLRVSQSLLERPPGNADPSAQPKVPPPPKTHGVAVATDEKSTTEPLFPRVSQAKMRVRYPALLLQRCVRRGLCLGGPKPLEEALDALCTARKGLSGWYTLVWRLLISALEDVGPYAETQANNSASISIPSLLGIALVAHVDPEFAPPDPLARKIKSSALALQSLDDPGSVWPWKGFRHSKAKLDTITEWARDPAPGPRSRVRDALRAAIMSLPVSAGELDLLRCYIGLLAPDSHIKRSPEPLPAPPTASRRPPQDPETSAVEAAVRLSAFDHQLHGNVLLFLQALLPYPPSEPSQHSLRALSGLVWRLNSGVNARTARRDGGPRQELFRIMQFADTSAKDIAAEAEAARKKRSDDRDCRDSDANPGTRSYWKAASVEDVLTLSDRERGILTVIRSVQKTLRRCNAAEGYGATQSRDYKGIVRVKPEPSSALHSDAFAADISDGEMAMLGTMPSPLDARTAFLQLFGQSHVFSATSTGGDAAPSKTRRKTRKPEPKIPCIVYFGDAADDNGAAEPAEKLNMDDAKSLGGRSSLLDSVCAQTVVSANSRETSRTVTGPAHAELVDKLICRLEEGLEVDPGDAPEGFAWRWDYNAALRGDAGPDGARTRTVRVWVRRRSRGVQTLANFEFFANGLRVRLFDASRALVPCERPVRPAVLKEEMKRLVDQALYVTPQQTAGSNSDSPATDPVQLLKDLEAAARLARRQSKGRSDRFQHVFDWSSAVAQSPLGRHVWRDLFVKLATRESAHVHVSPVDSLGARKVGSVRQMTEGTVLRLMFLLQALYPHNVRRSGELAFTVGHIDTPSYLHMVRAVRALAFGSAAGAGSDKAVDMTPVPVVSTSLWPHQAKAVKGIVGGIRAGKRGFADASAVGAGKTLTALATMCGVSRYLQNDGGPSTNRHGFLVLVPTSSLIREWTSQALQHTRGLHVVTQRANGALMSRGVSNAGARPNKLSAAARRHIKLDGNSIVVSTLSRVRDHPFTQHPGWDLVVVDECLSVQNDAALHTGEAWRQVTASSCGVVLLSATFFRSKFSKLFYMIRMLRSPLPRTKPYLPALLKEHIVCHIPENRRTWKVRYHGLPLPPADRNAYAEIMRKSSAQARTRDARVVFGRLKAFLRERFETEVLPQSVASVVADLVTEGRRPIVFARTRAEAGRFAELIPGARRLGKKIATTGEGPLVVTVAEASHGLNLQHQGDAIVIRPQPGDVMEQVKGRIDRPGQRHSRLSLTLVYAQDTVEELEAANIKICGSFFRQYLDPLSETFQQHVVDASLATAGPGTSASSSKNQRLGALGQAYLRRVRTLEGLLSGNDSSAGPVSTRGSPGRSAGSAVAGGGDDGDDQGIGQGPSRVDESAPSEQKTPKKTRKRRKRASPAASSSSPRGKKRSKNSPNPTVGADREGPQPRIDSALVSRALAHLTERDPKLANVIRQVGPPTGLIPKLGINAFKALCRSIVYQQLSVKSASAIFGRLAEACGGEVTPERILALELDDSKVRLSIGLSRPKVKYVRSLAESFQNGQLDDETLGQSNDNEVMRRVCAVKGLGEWSVHMFMMFSLGRPDVLPVGDLVVRKAFRRLYGLRNGQGAETAVQVLPKRDEMIEIAEKWRPYRTIGSWFMWHVVETEEAAYTFGAK